eukprot:6342247-Prorocentrum_lima.AAC.1
MLRGFCRCGVSTSRPGCRWVGQTAPRLSLDLDHTVTESGNLDNHGCPYPYRGGPCSLLVAPGYVDPARARASDL